MFELIVTKIVDEMAKNGLTQTEMANLLGIPQPTLSRILDGKREMGIKVAGQILAVRPQWISLISKVS